MGLEMFNLKKGRHSQKQTMWKGLTVVFKYVTLKLYIKEVLCSFSMAQERITRSTRWKVQGSTFWLNVP